MPADDPGTLLLKGLTGPQADAVRCEARRLLVLAGAGSGKTEVIARRIAFDVGARGADRDRTVAFTFTERAAEEMQFRIRRHLAAISREAGSSKLGGMYVGTIHAFCLKLLRELAPDEFHNFDVLDDGARIALVERSFWRTLAGERLRDAFKADGARGHYECVERFLHAYDLMNEYHQLDVVLPRQSPPPPGGDEEGWCARARLRTRVGSSPLSRAFATSAARFYALLHCRRFLDFSTAQAELLRLLDRRPDAATALRERVEHLVVDEVQDVNPVQATLIRRLTEGEARLTAVGDHRQAIFGWRGGRVDVMGALHDELAGAPDGLVIELEENFRSTPRVIALANRWAQTITPPGGMSVSEMSCGRPDREDSDPSHVAFAHFDDRAAEAAWIAAAIERLVCGAQGARHDDHDGERGLRRSDVAILLRSSGDARTYGDALRERGIPAIFRGADLFAQPEVLLLVAALARAVGLERFKGRAIQGLAAQTLGCPPRPEAVVRAAAAQLASRGLPIAEDCAERMVLLAGLIAERIESGRPPGKRRLAEIRSRSARKLLRSRGRHRRVFPQTIFHCLLEEAGVSAWDAMGQAGETEMYHLGALSGLVTSLETPGWVSPQALRHQIIGLSVWGPSGARLPEPDLLGAPDAVSIGTVHSAKGLEWPAVFVSDVNVGRFPSQRSRSVPTLPFDGPFERVIDPAGLADNENLDSERRLMYVALTRAERFLFLSSSGARRSRFRRELEPLVASAGGVVGSGGAGVPANVELLPGRGSLAAERLVSSFSDLRYFIECPHDFYLRKVLGFGRTIDQAFGYGRAVHNLMRAVHADPDRWAALADDPDALRDGLWDLIDDGLFFLRYTGGTSLDRMRRRGVEIVVDYVCSHADELGRLQYEPEREFETLLEEEQVLISGAIDVVRRDAPPRVTLIDFKSGDRQSDMATALDADEMRLQVSLYGIAARAEMEYEPELGLVRYLAEPNPDARELEVPLDGRALDEAASIVATTARRIKAREFHEGPTPRLRDLQDGPRCDRCDFRHFCGLRVAEERVVD